MSSALNISTIAEEHIFGSGSHFVEAVSSIGSVDYSPMSNDPSLELVVMVVTLIYIIWIGRSIRNLDGASFRVSNPFAKITEVSGLGGSIKIGDIALDWFLVISMAALLVTRVIDVSQSFSPEISRLTLQITELGIWRWMILMAVISLAVMLWGVVFVKVMGYMLRCEWMESAVTLLKSRLLMMAVVWVLPLVLMSMLEKGEFLMSYVAIITAVTFVGIYLFRTFLLFKSQKISILHWILYLCGVEIVPLTLFWRCFVSYE